MTKNIQTRRCTLPGGAILHEGGMARETLLMYAMVTLAERDVSDGYRAMVLAHCRSFARWSKRAVRIDEVNAADVNAWLAWLRSTKRTPDTIDTYRRNLLTIWREAFETGANDNPPLRVKRIKKPRRVIRAYRHEEINQLLAAAAKLKGRHKNGNRRSAFWCCLIHSAYSTGLRRGDLLLVFRSDIAQDGTYTLVQSKTGKVLRVKFSVQALAYMALLTDRNGLALPWPYRKDALVPRFNALKKLAGISRGSLKWLRRAAGSYADRIRPGDGPRLLGHSPQVFRMSYEDLEITGQEPPEPPRLG